MANHLGRGAAFETNESRLHASRRKAVREIGRRTAAEAAAVHRRLDQPSPNGRRSQGVPKRRLNKRIREKVFLGLLKSAADFQQQLKRYRSLRRLDLLEPARANSDLICEILVGHSTGTSQGDHLSSNTSRQALVACPDKINRFNGAG